MESNIWNIKTSATKYSSKWKMSIKTETHLFELSNYPVKYWNMYIFIYSIVNIHSIHSTYVLTGKMLLSIWKINEKSNLMALKLHTTKACISFWLKKKIELCFSFSFSLIIVAVGIFVKNTWNKKFLNKSICEIKLKWR